MKAGSDKPEDIIKGVLGMIYSSLAEPAAKWTKHKRLYDKYGALRNIINLRNLLFKNSKIY